MPSRKRVSLSWQSYFTCFKCIYTGLRFIKVRRFDLLHQLLNKNCSRSQFERDVFNFPSINNCFQINEHNFSSMEFLYLINCFEFFGHSCQIRLCFSVINQELNHLDSKLIVEKWLVTLIFCFIALILLFYFLLYCICFVFGVLN